MGRRTQRGRGIATTQVPTSVAAGSGRRNRGAAATSRAGQTPAGAGRRPK